MKLKIAVRILGHKSPDLNLSTICKWHSELWEIYEGRIETLSLNGDCDLDGWGYSDKALAKNPLGVDGANFTIYILNVPLEGNYYFRRIAENVGCFSLFEVGDILRSHNIPLENAILRTLYAGTMIYLCKKSFPSMQEWRSSSHHETKGCIFDMNGIKTNILFSCDRPILCESCCVAARKFQVSNENIKTFQKEILKIKKRRYYRISDWVKRRPLWAIFISGTVALIIGILGSIIGSYIYDGIKMRDNKVPSASVSVNDTAEQPQYQPNP